MLKRRGLGAAAVEARISHDPRMKSDNSSDLQNKSPDLVVPVRVKSSHLITRVERQLSDMLSPLGRMSRAVSQLLKRVLMVPPKHFTVEYTINPWMGGVVDKAKAFEQWSELKTAIEKEGVEVILKLIIIIACSLNPLKA
ncbi:unnamed protein product [Toxocara canis]|uniref:SMP-LTD domain-containing protein n=1 Tax=Toxocara canis TaxID=6265 RepID=A0A183VFF3_TOXCA|nr:unnamed protein product [Toxocara canis]